MSITQDPNAAKVALDTKAPVGLASLARQERQPGRGSALPPRPGALHRRHQAPRHGARRDRAQPARPRAHRRASTLEAAKRLPGVIAVVTGKRRRRAGCAAAVVRGRPDRPGHDRDREGAPLRRDGRSGDRRESLHRRGRVRPDRGRVRAAARSCSTRSRLGRTARRSCTSSSGRTRRTSARSRSARSTRRSRRRRGRCEARLRWPRSTGMPMDTNGAIGDYDPGTGVVTIYANSMNFTYFLWLIAGVAEDSGEQAQPRSGRGGRQLRLEVLHAQGADLRGVPVDGWPGAP